MLTLSANFDSVESIIKRKGIENGGAVHQKINSLILDYCEMYIPKKSGALIASGGAGERNVCWRVPYAKKQYYENGGSGLRGRLWFERMWASRGGEIISKVSAYGVKKSSDKYERIMAVLNMGEGPRRIY